MIQLSIFSFFLTVLLIRIFSLVFQRVQILDTPEIYGHQRAPLPYGMGIVLFLSLVIGALVFIPLSSKLLAVIIAALIITSVSFLDDRYKLSPFLRLGVQILCAAFLAFSGIIVPAISNPFGDPIVLDSFLLYGYAPLAILVAIFWITFVMNAMNWLDGVPGMVSGISAITCLIVFLLTLEKDLHIIDQSTLSLMALLIGFSSLAFWVYDFPPPKVLMGDTGTMFLGFLLALMALFAGAKFATIFIVLAIPLFDALWTIGRRIAKKKSPFKGDFEHFHHELLRSGFSERAVNGIYYLISIVFGLSALYLNSLGKFFALVGLFALLVIFRFSLKKRTSFSTSSSHLDP